MAGKRVDWLAPIKGFLDVIIPIIDKVPVVRALIGTLLVFFVPGFAWTFVFFKKLQFIERLVFSVALSIALVTLTIVFTNIVFRVRITGLNSIFIIVFLTLIPLVVYYASKHNWKMRNKAD